MFARTESNLPSEPVYANTLAELGYKVENGQFISVSNGKHFPFHSTDNERVNEVKRAAMHRAARDEVMKAAAGLGMKAIYVNGKDYTTTKPTGQHLCILTTNLDALKTKKSVVIVIGEHTQDLGIWAYRHLTREGGIDGGSVVGLLKALNELNLENPITEGAAQPPVVSEKVGAAAETAPKDTTMSDSVTGVASPGSPGVIILNPGQLIYSHKTNECMTMRSWMARPKIRGIGGNYHIHEVHNRIPGHKTPYEHVFTTFEDIIPQLVGNEEGVRLFVVGITDGAENFITYFDSKLVKDNTTTIGGLVTAMAFMEPTHDVDKVVSPPVKTMLHSYGKCWIKSSKPKGKWINVPGGMTPIMSAEELTLMEEEKRAKRVKVKDATDKAPEQQVDSTQPEASGRSTTSNMEDDSIIDDPEFGGAMLKTKPRPLVLDDSDKSSDEGRDSSIPRSLAPEAYTYCPPFPVVRAKSGNESAGEPEKKTSHASSTDSDSPPESLKLLRMSTGSHIEHPLEGEGEGDDPPQPKAVVSLKASSSGSDENTSPSMNTPVSGSPQSLSSHIEDSEDGDDPMADSYDYTDNVVSCHTYSGGTDIDEMIWPNVMEDVLDFFKDVVEKEEKAKRAAGMQ